MGFAFLVLAFVAGGGAPGAGRDQRAARRVGRRADPGVEREHGLSTGRAAGVVLVGAGVALVRFY